MKALYTLLILILPFVGISQNKFSLFGVDESNTTIATRDSSKTIGLLLENESLSYIINNKPESFIVTLPLFGEDVDLLLKINNTFFKNIIIESSGENGRENLNISPTIISYEIQFQNLSIGVLNFYNGTISSTFNIKNTQFEISEYNNQYLLIEVNNSINNSGFSCATESQSNNIGYSPVESDNTELNSIGCIEFAIDIDYYTRQTFSSDLEATNWALAIFAGVAQLYQAQSNFSVVVDYLNIWNITDPYAAYVQDAGGMLDSFGDHWNANFTDIPRDLTHLLTKRSNTGTGGIAWIDVLCNTNYRYGFSSALTNDTTYTFPNPTYTWNLNVCAHEIGHNIGSNHTHDCNWTADASLGFSGGGIDNCGVLSGSGSDCNPPAPYPTDGIGTIMSYCHVGGSGISLEFNDIILSQGLVPFLESASCLHECGGCTDPLAMNYDPNAEIDDGSCDFDFVYGCDDPTACNYVDTAEVNDGSCIYAMEGFDCDSLCLGQNEETYVLTLFDSYGDGWHGGTGQHTLLINGISYGTEFTNGSTANTGLTEANYYLCIDEDICNEVSFINGGSWESECSFTISNSSDDILIYGDYNTSNETFGDACGNSALTYVPDDNFEQALIDFGYDDVLDDYVLTENISGLTYIDLCTKDIADLTGIEDFVSLTNLCCAENQLTTLDLSNNTQLEILNAFENQLTSIDISNSPALYDLNIRINQLAEIDLSNNIGLLYLDVNSNLLTNLDLSNNTNLTTINCGVNSILALDLSNNVNLSSVNCGFNEITSLDFSNNPDLTYINSRDNELTFLNVTNNTQLNYLNFSQNQLLNVDVSNNLLLEELLGYLNINIQNLDVTNNDSLEVLIIFNLGLSTIDLNNNLKLIELDVRSNQLTSLDISNHTDLIDLKIGANQLTTLDLRNGNNINMSLQATNNNLTCINVDDTEWATENWTNDNGSIDAQVSFSEDCQNLTYVPDDNFEQALIDFGYDNVLDDYVLTENILDITYLNVSTKGISDLTGIEDFESLEILYCFENNLSSLDISSNSNLITLYCYNNQITNIDISQNQNLESFDIGNNNLSSIDVSNNTSLALLHCYNNQLSSIDVSQNTLLINLYCWGNQISNLDISQNLELTKLQCYDNLLSILDISLNTELEDLYCSSNQLSSLNLNNNIDLVRLRCGINQLSSLDVSNNLDLEIIYCSDNAITELDVSTNSFLSEFYCSVNELTKLDVSNNTNLTILNCSNNDLDSLNLKNGNNTQMVLTASSNPDLFCINVDDTDWSNANWTNDNGSIDAQMSFSEDCELGFVNFGCTDSTSCNFQPTANIDDESCFYLVSSYDTVVSCDNYFWNDSMYYQSGNYTINNSSIEGCDSIANLNLTILQSDSIFNDTTVCDEFIWAEDTIISSGNYFFAYTNSNGCDSIHYFDVTVNPSSEAIDEKFTCEDSFLWFDNNTYFEDNFTAEYIIANEYNCPLTITLNLTFLENPTSQTVVEECESYTWNGSTYNTSGQYTYTTTADNGCDSTATLDLTINDSQFSTDVQFDCNEFTWIDGITYTESNNSATVTLTANNGCDSIVTLNLTIYESDTTFSSITACDEFIWNNISYTQSGFYTNTFENTNGCDSTHIYDLTILESTFGIDTQVQCDEYTWIDGNTYTQSTNSPTFTLTNSLGCDSTVTLNLTINLSDTSFTDVTACESYEWNGTTLTESGTYFNSIAVNNIDISGFNYAGNYDGNNYYLSDNRRTWIEADSICNSIGGNLVVISDESENNFITNILSTFGPDYFNYPYDENSSGAWIGMSNSSGSWNWINNEPFNYSNWNPGEPNGSGNYIQIYHINSIIGKWDDTSGELFYLLEISEDLLLNLDICDSVSVLNLTISQPDTSFTDITACDSYEWNGETYSESGTYSYSELNNNEFSMNFDGENDYINLGPFTNYNLNNSSTSITVMLKAYVSDFGYQNSTSYIFGTPMFEGNNDRGFRIETNANNTFGIAAGGNSNIVYTYSANKQVNFWYDIAMVLDQVQDIIFLYVDGVLESQISISQIGTINNLYNLNIGAFENGSLMGNLFSGLVDNISIWNNALTQGEIQSYMSCPPTGNEEGLVGYWNFEEGEGNTVYDLSGNGNDGTINGATYSSDTPEQSCQLTTVNGCDSIAILNLTITQPDTSFAEITACDSYDWNGVTLTESGTYFYPESQNLQTIDGFSYMGQLDNSLYYISENLTDWNDASAACVAAGGHLVSINSEEENNFIGTNLTNNSIWIGLYQASDNSAWQLTDGSDPTYFNWRSDQPGGSNQNCVDFYYDASVAGSVFENQYNVWTDANCNDNYYYILEIPSNELTTINGCDSVAVIDLTINESTFGIDTQVHCDEYTWIDGNTYTESTNSPTFTLTNSLGCDSTVTLNLTINLSDTSFTDITACESFEWNGETYTESGSYTQSISSNNEFSMNFDGDDDYLFIEHSNSLEIGEGSISYEMWFKKSAVTFFSQTNLATNYINQTTPLIGLYVGGTNEGVNEGKLNFSYRTSQAASEVNLKSDFRVDDDIWHHVVGVKNTTTDSIYLYIDGELVNQTNILSGNTDTYQGYVLGGNHLNRFMNVDIDAFRIWSTALSQQKIQQYMNCPPSGNEEDLIGYWDFEEGEGNTVYDLTSNNNNGIINGATYSNDVPEQSCQLTAVNGCDSIAVLNLTITQQDTSYSDITACESYEWNGQTYTESGEYTNTYTNVNSCDSVAVLNLTITQPDTSYSDITACESYEWNGQTYTESGTYTSNSTTCNNYALCFDGINDYLELQNSNIQNINSLTIETHFNLSAYPSSSGQEGMILYAENPNNNSQRECELYFNKNNGNLEFTIANQSSFVSYSYSNFNLGQWYLLKAEFSNGLLKLYVDNILVSTATSSISYLQGFDDIVIGSLLQYNDYFNGCLDILNLSVNGNLVLNWNFEEGEGDTAYDLSGNGNDALINGATYVADVPEQSCQITTVNGCDSVAVLNLTINPTTFGTDTQIHCDEYTWIDGNTYTQSTNSPTFTLTNSIGCDSIVILDLSILESTSSFTSTSACESYFWNDSLYTESGLKVFNTTNSVGCDSIARLFLTINEPTFATDTQVHCDEFTWIDGISYTENNDSATHTITAGNSNGCDSIVSLNLTIYQSDTSFTEITTCDSYEWNGQTYTESGTYTQSISSNNEYSMSFDGVDDEIICLNPLLSNMNELTIMFSAKFSSNNYSTIITDWPADGGNFKIDTYSNNIRFDIITNTEDYYETIYSFSENDFNTWINWAYTFNGNTAKIYKNGELVQTNDAVNGTISPSSSNIIFANEENNNGFFNGYIDMPSFWNRALSEQDIQQYMSCPPISSEPDLLAYWNFEEVEGNTVYDLSGNGNDGIIYGANYSSDIPEQSCQLTSSLTGCDSVAVLNLTINPTTFGTDTQIHCDEYTWIDGNTYTQSTNSPTFTLTNSLGCDSIVILDLSILESTSSFTSASACESYLWNDSLYTESGLKVFNTTNSVGCDSIARLFLTIYEPTFGIDTQVHCDEFTWIDGISYTENNNSATHTIIGGNSNGCDSIVTLNLTIFNSVNTFGDTTVCDEFVWNGINYTESGIFSNIFENSNGCDSIVTLDLVINNSVIIFDTLIICKDDFVSIGNNIYTSSGDYTDSLITINNCDSIIYTNIILNDIDIVQNDTVLCYNDSINLSLSSSENSFGNSSSYCSPMPYVKSSGIEYYVSPTGSDVSSAGSLSNPFQTIQYAINQVSNDEIITLLDGTYSGIGNINLDLQGKSIILQSENGANCAIIDCELQERAFHLYNGESINTIIKGISIINGQTNSIPTGYGSAIFVEDNSGITIINCVFEGNQEGCIKLGNNETSGPQSAIYNCIFRENKGNIITSSKKSFVVENCLFEYNIDGVCGSNGHAADPAQHYKNCVFRNNTNDNEIVTLGHDKDLINCLFYENTSINKGIIYFGTIWSGQNLVDHCTFYNNTCEYYTSSWYDHKGDVKNSIFSGTNSSAIDHVSGNQTIIDYYYSNGDGISDNGNFNGSPGFIDADNNDFNLSSNSICVGTDENGSNIGVDMSLLPTWMFAEQMTYSNDVLWSTGDSTPTITVKPTQTTTYWVSQTLNGVTCYDSITVTVQDSSVNNLSLTACDSYEWDNTTYTTSGLYTNIYTGQNGCDSTVTLDLTIVNSFTDTVAISACHSYFWNDSTYFLSGEYSFEGLAENGCDSIARLFLTIYEPTFGIDTQVHCDEFTWIDGISYTESNDSATHTITGGNSNGCDSIVTLNLTIFNSVNTFGDTTVCDEFVWNGINYTESGIFSNSFVNSNGCDSTHTIDITILESTFGVDTQIHCDEYTWIDGNTYTESTNSPSFTLTNSLGCDSIVILNLSILESTSSFTSASACESYLWNDSLYIESGLKVFNTTNSVGCDSIARLFLTIYEPTFATDTQVHCDEFTWIDGISYTGNNDSATHTIIGGNSNGCDSIVTLNLTIYQTDTSLIEITSCDNYEWNGNIYTESGIYTNSSQQGDNIFSVDFDGTNDYITFGDILNNPTFPISFQYNVKLSTDLALGESITAFHTDNDIINGSIYYGIWSHISNTGISIGYGDGTGQGQANRRSYKAENLNLNHGQWYNIVTIIRGPQDMSIYLDGIEYTGAYSGSGGTIANSENTFQIASHYTSGYSPSFAKCSIDNFSYWDLDLSISDIQKYMSCSPSGEEEGLQLYLDFEEGEGNTVYDLSGNGNDGIIYGANYSSDITEQSCQLTSSLTGCDSVAVLNLTILETTFGIDTQVHCDNYTWINGITYTESTSSPTYVLTNSVGCDSVVTLNLSILESDSTFVNETHCDQLVWDDSTYTISGIYTNYYTNVEGCDSSHTINLSIYYSDSSFAQITACDEFVWEGSVYTESGFYTNSYTNANGCDSTNTLDLTILNSSSGTDTQVHCDNYTWIDGITYTQSTSSPTYVLTNSVGCDSVVTLNLSILESDSTFVNETHCDQLVWDDSTYTISGIYTNYYTNVEGCDSSHTINLSIYYSDSSFAQITACDEFVWEGSVYTESGFYTNSYTNANGCDSTNTLDLTILNSSSGTDTQVHCDNYTWIDGITYTQSTSSPNYVLTNSVGCDSVVTLNLSILESDSTFTNEIHCDQLVWDDSTYTISGIYTNYYTNVEGCDSSHTINLSIYYSDSSFAQITACDEFVWEGSVYTESGFYTNSYTNANGCDSTNTLDLTILNSSSGSDTQVHCDEFIWIDGITYTESTSSPTYVLTNSVGCDSVVTLELSILESDSTFISETHCDEFIWDDSTYTSTGTYTNNYINTIGCDSIVTLNLTINNSANTFENISICDVFIWDDSTYTESGSYTNNYTTTYGCDSTHTINLTILNSNIGTDVEEHCDEFTWIDGITYTESTNSPTYTLTNSVGCDSIVTLNLTINNSYNLDTNIISCDAFFWDDSTYIESGVYTNFYTSINGCDSTYTINLTLLETTYGTDSIVSCDEYTWIDGISYTENTNSPTFTLTNSVGCDSVVNLNLTILESTETNTSIVACDNFEWYGTTYYQSGTYYNYSINSVGCDLIEVLELTIENCGCIDPIADNFNPNATLDDGSCVYCESFSIIITASSDVSEVGGNDGYVFASGINGSAQYSLNVFDENFIPQNPFGLTAGIYTVAVFDAVTGCVAETLFTIYEPTVYFNCTNLGCVESSVMDDSYSTLEECEANCSSVTVSPCDSVPNGLFVDNVIDNRIRFNWSPTEVAPSHYMIRYRELGTNSWTVITAGPVNTQAYYGTSRTRYFMEPATTYEWSIRARVLNDDLSIDCQSAWSATSEYTTLPACANLENLSVFTEANWVTFFADAPSEEWGVWQSKGKIREFGSTNYRYVNGDDNGNINSLKGNFTESTNYEWHTKAWCTANVDEDGNSDPMYHSGWGEFSNFTTEDPCDKMPINLSTSSNGANTAVIMSWDTPLSGNPDHYFLEMTNITSGAVYEWNNIPGSDNSKTKFNQSSGDEISWKIRGACGTNGTSFATPFSSTVYYVLGGEKLSSVQNLLVYPNPSRKEFNISFDISERQIVDMKVVNSIGQEVYKNSLEIKGTFDTKIDLSGYSKGVYNLSIKTTDGIKNHKLILQ